MIVKMFSKQQIFSVILEDSCFKSGLALAVYSQVTLLLQGILEDLEALCKRCLPWELGVISPE